MVNHRIESQSVSILDNQVSLLRNRLVCEDRIEDVTTDLVTVLGAVRILVKLDHPLPAAEGHSLEDVNRVSLELRSAHNGALVPDVRNDAGVEARILDQDREGCSKDACCLT